MELAQSYSTADFDYGPWRVPRYEAWKDARAAASSNAKMTKMDWTAAAPSFWGWVETRLGEKK